MTCLPFLRKCNQICCQKRDREHSLGAFHSHHRRTSSVVLLLLLPLLLLLKQSQLWVPTLLTCRTTASCSPCCVLVRFLQFLRMYTLQATNNIPHYTLHSYNKTKQTYYVHPHIPTDIYTCRRSVSRHFIVGWIGNTSTVVSCNAILLALVTGNETFTTLFRNTPQHVPPICQYTPTTATQSRTCTYMISLDSLHVLSHVTGGVHHMSHPLYSVPYTLNNDCDNNNSDNKFKCVCLNSPLLYSMSWVVLVAVLHIIWGINSGQEGVCVVWLSLITSPVRLWASFLCSLSPSFSFSLFLHRWFNAHTIQHHIQIYPPKRFLQDATEAAEDGNSKYYLPAILIPYVMTYMVRDVYVRMLASSNVAMLLFLW